MDGVFVQLEIGINKFGRDVENGLRDQDKTVGGVWKRCEELSDSLG